MAVFLTEDLMLEILLRLPPVSVFRFKPVCKLWYSLISSPCFLRNHACQFHLSQRCGRLDPPGLLLSPEVISSERTELSVYAILSQDQDDDDHGDVQDQKPKPKPPLLKLHLDHSLHAFEQKIKISGSRCSIIDSVNGLLLYMKESAGISAQYIVFNPITNQHKEVPMMDRFWRQFNEEHLRLGLQPTKYYSPPRILFDPSLLLSYKILLVFHEPRQSHSELYVYSDHIGSWRLVTKLAITYINGTQSLMHNGVFYWLIRHDDVSICFDVVEENVWFQPLPPIPAGYTTGRRVLYFGVCGGRLLLIEQYFGGMKDFRVSGSFDIMEMEQGSTIWTVKSRVNIEAGYDNLIKKRTYPLFREFKVMHLYKTEKGEEEVLLNIDHYKIVSLNITTNNNFGKEITIPNYIFHSLKAFPFTPTLFPLT